ncbi:MAG: hypothetical protein C4530_09995 [Desulfobacteraceae bacterium]|nr:MAG: hypothetical protein C4530_09995 [Desulfobacteraceae bacterium]
MGILDSLIHADALGRHELTAALQDLRQGTERERTQGVLNDFFRSGSYKSADDVWTFAAQRKLSLPQAIGLLELSGKFQSLIPKRYGPLQTAAADSKTFKPGTVFQQGPEGKYSTLQEPKDEKIEEAPLYNTITREVATYPKAEASRIKMSAPSIYQTEKERTGDEGFKTVDLYGPGLGGKIRSVTAKSQADYDRFISQGFKEGKLSAEPGYYSPQQMIDDTRAYYDTLSRAMIDPEFKTVRSEYKSQYNQLIRFLNEDLARVSRGEKPLWMTGEREFALPGGDAAAGGKKRLSFDKKSGWSE